MMIMQRILKGIAVVSLAAAITASAYAQPANNQPPPYDCSGIYGVKAKDSYFKLKAADIESCIMRGWDPPGKLDSSYDNQMDYNWQPAGGTPVRTGNAGNIDIGAKQPPAVPPGSSSSSTPTGPTGSTVFFANQPNQSSQCFDFNGQRVCPRCSVNRSTGQNECEVPVIDPATGQITWKPSTGNEEEREIKPTNPVAGDMGGQLGPISLVRNGAQLSCGGTMNLSNTEVSTVLNATHLVVAKELDRNVRVYARNGNNFAFLRQVRLAKNVCGVDDDKRTRPINQFVFFNAMQPKVALRAIQPTKLAQEQNEGEAVVMNSADEENYILINPGELINGGDRGSCEEFKRYPKNIPDFRIMPARASDDVTMELPLNTDACKDRVLHLDLSTPNLVHQPGVTVNAASIADYPQQPATLTTQGSLLYFQPDTFLRLAVPNAQFTFRGAIAMELPNFETLHMYGPTIFTNGLGAGAAGAISSQIYLGGGGHIEDVEGNIRQRIPPTQSYTPPNGITAPYYIIADEKIYMPPGLTLLNERGGYVREPSNPPPPPANIEPTGP